ncbi:hypothetical protein D3C84_662920 [compost metagenome]
MYSTFAGKHALSQCNHGHFPLSANEIVGFWVSTFQLPFGHVGNLWATKSDTRSCTFDQANQTANLGVVPHVGAEADQAPRASLGNCQEQLTQYPLLGEHRAVHLCVDDPPRNIRDL